MRHYISFPPQKSFPKSFCSTKTCIQQTQTRKKKSFIPPFTQSYTRFCSNISSKKNRTKRNPLKSEMCQPRYKIQNFRTLYVIRTISHKIHSFIVVERVLYILCTMCSAIYSLLMALPGFLFYSCDPFFRIFLVPFYQVQ